jgi:hypothetical protein
MNAVRTPATGLTESIIQLILLRAFSHVSCRFILFIASSASRRASPGWRTAVVGSIAVEGKSGSETALAGENSTVCWATEGAAPSAGLFSASVVTRAEEMSAVIVEEYGPADMVVVKWSVAGLFGLPSPLLRTTATSTCGKLS